MTEGCGHHWFYIWRDETQDGEWVQHGQNSEHRRFFPYEDARPFLSVREDFLDWRADVVFRCQGESPEQHPQHPNVFETTWASRVTHKSILIADWGYGTADHHP